MNERIRIGAVNYLNTKPLIHDLETLAPEAELIIAYILPDELHLAQFFLDEDGRIIALQGECSLDLSRQAEGRRRLERVTIEIRRRRSQP